MAQLQCSLCSSFASPTFQGVLRHIGTEHAFDSNFHLQCGLDGCPRTFHKYSSWRSHLYRKHHKHMQEKISRINNTLLDATHDEVK